MLVLRNNIVTSCFLFTPSVLLHSSSLHQGPDYPNGTDGVPYWGSNNTLDCGDQNTMEGGCVFNVREDPNETKDLAAVRTQAI